MQGRTAGVVTEKYPTEWVRFDPIIARQPDVPIAEEVEESGVALSE